MLGEGRRCVVNGENQLVAQFPRLESLVSEHTTNILPTIKSPSPARQHQQNYRRFTYRPLPSSFYRHNSGGTYGEGGGTFDSGLASLSQRCSSSSIWRF